MRVALHTPHARIGVHGHDQSVAEPASLFEAADVTHVKQVEAAVRVYHPFASAPGVANHIGCALSR
jgi:hypothetical protein